MNNGLAECFDTRGGCVACVNGKCTALTGRLLIGMKETACPFYKTKKQKYLDDVATLLRLTNIGRVDLLKIYEEE